VAAGAERAGSGLVTAVMCAAFDPATDEKILAVRELVRAAGIELPALPPHRPHVSLAAARVDRRAGLPRLVSVAATVAAEHEPFDVALGQVGRFGRAGAIWLGPDASPALAALQRNVAAGLLRAGWPSVFGERSDPARWVAHCTLATRVPKPVLREVQAAVRAQYHPVQGSVEALATILVGGRGDVAHAALGRDRRA
jgi:2'-5' RNA ligase